MDPIKLALLIARAIELKQIALRYAFGFGLMAGLLFYTVGVYYIAGLYYDCACERVNIASYMTAHNTPDCAYLADLAYNEDPLAQYNRDVREVLGASNTGAP